MRSKPGVVQDGEIPDEYQFWGIVQKPGYVIPSNFEEGIFYTQSAIENSPDVVGTPIYLDHLAIDNVSQVGEVLAEKLYQSHLFVLIEITREGVEQFVEDLNELLDDENTKIDLSYNNLVRQIDDGQLAISAGLDISTVETAIDDHTVVGIKNWQEVSIVGAPAVPSSWAWPCEDQCDIVFAQTMTQELNIDVEALQQAVEESDGPASPKLGDIFEDELGNPHAVQISADGEVVVIEDEDYLTQSDCDCKEQYEHELEQLREQRDGLKEQVESFRERERNEVEQRLRDINESIPEDDRYSDEEIEQLTSDESIDTLRQTIDMMERLAENTQPTIQANTEPEDLSGTSGAESKEDTDEIREQVDRVAQSLVGTGFDDYMAKMEEKHG